MAVVSSAQVPANPSTPGLASPVTSRASGAGARAPVKAAGARVMGAHRHRSGLGNFEEGKEGKITQQMQPLRPENGPGSCDQASVEFSLTYPTQWDTKKIIFIETRLFAEGREESLPDPVYARMQVPLMGKPDLGDVMPGCGGLRKLWMGAPRQGKRKRGGCRVIHLAIPEARRIFLIDVYGKDEKDDLNSEEKKEFGSGTMAILPERGNWQLSHCNKSNQAVSMGRNFLATLIHLALPDQKAFGGAAT